jgi:hypothetical protein
MSWMPLKKVMLRESIQLPPSPSGSSTQESWLVAGERSIRTLALEPTLGIIKVTGPVSSVCVHVSATKFFVMDDEPKVEAKK